MEDSLPTNEQTKLVPHSLEAEEAVIGAILINPDAYYDVAQILQNSDFYVHRHRFIWEAITRLFARRTPLDFITLTEELDQAGRLAEIGGAAFLSGLLNQVPSSLHAMAYARIIEQTAVRRRMVEAAQQVVKLAFDERADLDTVIHGSERAILSASQCELSGDTQLISQVLGALYDQVDQPAQPMGLSSMSTGFVDLDRLLQGLQPSDLVIIAGRPGMGKTSLLLSIVRHAAMVEEKHLAFFTLETSKKQLTQRLLAQETGIETQRIRANRLNSDEWRLLTQAITKLSKSGIFLDDTPSITPHQLRAKCHRLHMKHRLDLIAVDYLQLMSGGERFENRVQEVSFISRQLKVLARELNVPVVAAAQLSRAVEQRLDKHPLLSDLRESGSIEMDADVVMFLYRPEIGDPSDRVDVIVAKQRNGPTGAVRLIFRKSLARFEDLTDERD